MRATLSRKAGIKNVATKTRHLPGPMECMQDRQMRKASLRQATTLHIPGPYQGMVHRFRSIIRKEIGPGLRTKLLDHLPQEKLRTTPRRKRRKWIRTQRTSVQFPRTSNCYYAFEHYNEQAHQDTGYDQRMAQDKSTHRHGSTRQLPFANLRKESRNPFTLEGNANTALHGKRTTHAR